ncbi:hypothetical protein PMAA_083310 [Talaromyces marneffei ATCC 18224]|uniref:Uncharacterized protein n=1 Tax=Talaromyces marneffei (strain ATCC 18224 / CBS 334.59 / QM 7333) TaxID=441960 RepID=B6QFU1_TALMQ|nr:hypothetical protein PMAA_083310 [Talaromyces marneffei ATCC 18224]
MTFDVITTTATALQRLLFQNKITSVQIVQYYFAQIDRHEPTLNALISPVPRDKILAIAATLDAERQISRSRRWGRMRSYSVILHGHGDIRLHRYALKPTVGIQYSTGLYYMTEFFDSPGPMAKSAADIRVLCEILLGRSFDMPTILNAWEGISVGFLDPKVWKMADDFCTQFEGTEEQMANEEEILLRFMSAYGEVAKPRPVPTL